MSDEASKLLAEALAMKAECKTLRDTLTAAQIRGSALHNGLVEAKGRVAAYWEACQRLKAELRRSMALCEATERRCERLRSGNLELQRDRDEMRDERNAVAGAQDEGWWVFEGSSRDDIYGMSEDMVVMMTAKQLRKLLAEAAERKP